MDRRTLGHEHIVCVSDLSPGSTGLQRFRALRRSCMNVVGIDSTPPGRLSTLHRLHERLASKAFRSGAGWVNLPDPCEINRNMLAAIRGNTGIVWIDKGLRVRPETLKGVRRRWPMALLVGYSLDNMLKRHNQSRQFLEGLPLYDLFVTNKSFSVDSLRQLGAREVMFVDNAFDRDMHRPTSPTARTTHLSGRVGFIGTWERQRERSIVALASSGVPVTVFGNDWPSRNYPAALQVEHEPIYGHEYASAIGSFAINLCFLRKENDDVQTTRSVEIPACGGVMLAERTEEHERLFRAGVEAEYFSSDEEMISKARELLIDRRRQEAMRAAARARCESSAYSYDDQIERILSRAAGLRRP